MVIFLRYLELGIRTARGTPLRDPLIDYILLTASALAPSGTDGQLNPSIPVDKLDMLQLFDDENDGVGEGSWMLGTQQAVHQLAREGSVVKAEAEPHTEERQMALCEDGSLRGGAEHLRYVRERHDIDRASMALVAKSMGDRSGARREKARELKNEQPLEVDEVDVTLILDRTVSKLHRTLELAKRHKLDKTPHLAG